MLPVRSVRPAYLANAGCGTCTPDRERRLLCVAERLIACKSKVPSHTVPVLSNRHARRCRVVFCKRINGSVVKKNGLMLSATLFQSPRTE